MELRRVLFLSPRVPNGERAVRAADQKEGSIPAELQALRPGEDSKHFHDWLARGSIPKTNSTIVGSRRYRRTIRTGNSEGQARIMLHYFCASCSIGRAVNPSAICGCDEDGVITRAKRGIDDESFWTQR